jgi:hypothetical protein
MHNLSTENPLEANREKIQNTNKNNGFINFKPDDIQRLKMLFELRLISSGFIIVSEPRLD